MTVARSYANFGAADLRTDGKRNASLAWEKYLDQVAPLRTELHAYCRRVSRNVWDAEDLLQDCAGRSAREQVHEERIGIGRPVLRVVLSHSRERIGGKLRSASSL